MAIDPNSLISPIQPGYVYQEVFYPVDSSAWLGYWYQNAFYGSEWLEAGYDFTQTIDAYPYSYSQNAYQQLPYGSVPGFSYLQVFYKTYNQARAYQFELFQDYQDQLEQAYLAHQPANLYNPAAPIPRSNERIAMKRKKKCFICSQDHSEFMDVLGKTCCLKCLKRKYESNELYLGTATNPLLWSPQIIYNVHRSLLAGLLPVEQIDPNKDISLPLDSYICIGRNQEAMPGYPPYGHFIGKNNLCPQESCPNTEHILCKLCALRLNECPACGQFIGYEQPRDDEYPECRGCHDADFEKPCSFCHKKATRRKGRPKGVSKEEEKKQDAK